MKQETPTDPTHPKKKKPRTKNSNYNTHKEKDQAPNNTTQNSQIRSVETEGTDFDLEAMVWAPSRGCCSKVNEE